MYNNEMNSGEGWGMKLGGRALEEGDGVCFGMFHNVCCTCSLHSIYVRIALQIKVFSSNKAGVLHIRNPISADFFLSLHWEL